MSKKKVENRKNYITAKLIFFDWGWADNIIYRQKARINEKEKGIQMISKLKDLFGITNKDIKESETLSIKYEIEKIKWTRDESGNIVSPFKSKKII